MLRHNADGFALQRSFNGKGHNTRRCGKQGVVTATADVVTGVELGATLAHDDVASLDQLAVVALHAKAFTFRIATVASTTACFLMSH